LALLGATGNVRPLGSLGAVGAHRNEGMDLQRGPIFKERSPYMIVIASDYVLGKSPMVETVIGFVIGTKPGL
jgi:hypothetical protein